MKTVLSVFGAVVLFSLGAAEPAVQGFYSESSWQKIVPAKNSEPRRKLIKENDAVTAVQINFPLAVGFSPSMYPCDGGSDPEKLYEGIAFEIQGDGSSEWGCITVGDTADLQGKFYFPAADKNWKEYRVSFSDMAPAGDHTSGLPSGMKVGMLTTFRFSDNWRITWCNQTRKFFSYKVRNLRLLEKIRPTMEIGKYKFLPLREAVKKMRDGKTVQITCFGDSITAGTGLRPGMKRYAVLLGEILREKFKNPKIRTVCTAVGGAHTHDSIGWLDKDLTAGIPDVAAMLIGYNNRSVGQTPEMYRKQLEMWLDRLAAKTKGQTAVILIPTVPGVPRWFSQDEFARITVETARKYQCTVAPIDQSVKQMGPKVYQRKYLRDAVHPNQAGHRLYAEILAKCF